MQMSASCQCSWAQATVRTIAISPKPITEVESPEKGTTQLAL